MLIRIFFEVFSPFLLKEIISKWKPSGILACFPLLDQISGLLIREKIGFLVYVEFKKKPTESRVSEEDSLKVSLLTFCVLSWKLCLNSRTLVLCKAVL